MLTNINETVKVRLTSKGIEILKKQHEIFRAKMLDVEPTSNIPEFDINSYVDQDGYYSAPLFVIMDQFGEHMSSPTGLPFEANFEIVK